MEKKQRNLLKKRKHGSKRKAAKKRREKKLIMDLALQRMEILFNLARNVFRQDPNLANRYVQIALRLGMKATVRVPVYWRRQICKKCKSFSVPGVNLRVRIKGETRPHVTYTCTQCGNIKRFPIKT